jgi:hypothetical protein
VLSFQQVCLLKKDALDPTITWVEAQCTCDPTLSNNLHLGCAFSLLRIPHININYVDPLQIRNGILQQTQGSCARCSYPRTMDQPLLLADTCSVYGLPLLYPYSFVMSVTLARKRTRANDARSRKSQILITKNIDKEEAEIGTQLAPAPATLEPTYKYNATVLQFLDLGLERARLKACCMSKQSRTIPQQQVCWIKKSKTTGVMSRQWFDHKSNPRLRPKDP